MGETKDVLTKARELVRGARQRFYGHPVDNFKCWTEMLSAYGFCKYDARDGAIHAVTAHDAIMALALLKIARARNGYHRDSAVDLGGYAALDEIICEPDAREAFDKDVAEMMWDE